MKRFVRIKVRNPNNDGFTMKYGDLEDDAEYDELIRTIKDGAPEDFIEVNSDRGIDNFIRRSEIIDVQAEPFKEGRAHQLDE